MIGVRAEQDDTLMWETILESFSDHRQKSAMSLFGGGLLWSSINIVNFGINFLTILGPVLIGVGTVLGPVLNYRIKMKQLEFDRDRNKRDDGRRREQIDSFDRRLTRPPTDSIP